MNTYNIYTHTKYKTYDNLHNSDIAVSYNNTKLLNTDVKITKSLPKKEEDNYTKTNNIYFNATGLPEKVRKYYRYDFNSPIQSAWIEFYRHKNK